jgi:imidazolonepropionase-like amidohydrolase
LSYQARSAIDPVAWHVDASSEQLFRRMHDGGIVLDATLDTAFRHPSPQWPVPLVAREACQHGALVCAGTDDDADWRNPDSALLIEISRVVHDVGMTPTEALRAATQVGAHTVGAQAQMGSIEPGKLASFMVLAGNPLADIANLHDIVEVAKRGRSYLRRDYHPVRPGRWTPRRSRRRPNTG